jgi:hypothetical protein
MVSPRDPQQPLAVPVNVLTGKPVTAQQAQHVNAITDAVGSLLDVLHNAEGTTAPGQHQEHQFQTRRMSIAHTLIEQAVLFALKEVLK